jgi:hypothetical protein
MPGLLIGGGSVEKRAQTSKPFPNEELTSALANENRHKAVSLYRDCLFAFAVRHFLQLVDLYSE